jgi:hypothetical protein
MRFASGECEMPERACPMVRGNNDLILSTVICKKQQYTQILQQIVSFSRARKGEESLHFLRKKKGQRTYIGKARGGRGGGGGRRCLIVQMEPWLGFRRGVGGWWMTTNEQATYYTL